MKIQSFSDIITNSSSETFLRTTAYAEQNLEDFINSILRIVKSEYTCDELFEIKDFGTCLYIKAVQKKDEAEVNNMDELINDLFYVD